MALIDRLRNVKDRLGVLPTRFGDPRHIQVVMVKPDGTQVLITPNPKVTEVDPRLVSSYIAVDSVKVAVDDLLMEGISRSYNLTDLQQSRFLLNAVWNGTIWTGKKAEVSMIDTSAMLDYKVVVRLSRNR